MQRIPRTFTAPDGSQVDFLEVNHVFGQTAYGQTLKRNVRWDRFQPPGCSNSEWEKLLGSDANNYRHLLLSFGIMKSFLGRLVQDKSVPLSPHDLEILLLTPLVHDWAEAIVGDINLEYKTASHEKKERTILKRQMEEVVPQLLSNETRAEVLDVVFDQKSRLGSLFNITEKIGYFRTAMNAWKRIKNGGSHHSLNALITNVFGFNLPKLTELSGEFQPVKVFLEFHNSAINQVLDHYSDYDFDFYPEYERQPCREKFIKATDAWTTHQRSKIHLG